MHRGGISRIASIEIRPLLHLEERSQREDMKMRFFLLMQSQLDSSLSGWSTQQVHSVDSLPNKLNPSKKTPSGVLLTAVTQVIVPQSSRQLHKEVIELA